MRGLSPEIRVIFAEEFRRRLSRLGFAFFTLLPPILFLIAIPLTPVIVDLLPDGAPDAVASADANAERIGYADPSSVLRAPTSPAAPILYNNRSEGIEAVRQGQVDLFFLLSPDYIETGLIEIYDVSDEGGRFEGNWSGKQAFANFLRVELIAGQVEDKVLSRAINPGNFQDFKIGDDGVVTGKIPLAQEIGELLIPMLFAALLVVGVIMGSGTLLSSVGEEKETRMFEILVTSASAFSIMAGKLLAAGLAGLIQIAVWVTVAAFTLPEVFNRIPNGGELTLSTSLLATVSLSLVLGYFLFSVLALMLASLAGSAQTAQQYNGVFSLMVGFPIYLTGLFINQPDTTFAQILSYIPFTAPTVLMVRLAGGSLMSAGDIATSLAIVAVSALVLLWVAGRVFRMGILMSGQRITGRNLWDALRHSG